MKPTIRPPLESRLQPVALKRRRELACRLARITEPTPIRLKPGLQRDPTAMRASASSGLSPEAGSLRMPTTCGDFQPKKCALDFGPSGKSMENAPPLSSRVHPFIAELDAISSIQSPRMTFHREMFLEARF